MIPAGKGHADHCCLECDKHWLEHLDARSHIDNLKDLFSMILFIFFVIFRLFANHQKETVSVMYHLYHSRTYQVVGFLHMIVAR